MKEVVLATRSVGKVRELGPLFEEFGIRTLGLHDVGVAVAPEEDAIEVFETFEANALAKARYFFARAGGRAVVADDSGIEVTALSGQPGVHSRRWGWREGLEGDALDAANNARLQQALRGKSDRSARYVCVAAWLDGAAEACARGEAPGRVLEAPRGSGGFGYDPYFWSDEVQGTFAEVSREAKATVSHRGRAIRALLTRLGHGR
ncbi:MAG: non-canonical purine NTP pyrophosphatase [Gemmatimonadaceae bacterium]|nr:non-canonical purine NTP pyrophosphatase [Gemmatimonadaceae bacterium]